MAIATKRRDRTRLARQYLFGLRRTSDHHTPAYAFSIAAGVTAVALTKNEGMPTYLELFMFIVGSGTIMSITNAAATRLYRTESREQPQHVIAFATSLSVVSISASVGAAIGVAAVLSGWSAWLIGGAAFTLVYLLVAAAEVAIGAAFHREGYRARGVAVWSDGRPDPAPDD